MYTREVHSLCRWPPVSWSPRGAGSQRESVTRGVPSETQLRRKLRRSFWHLTCGNVQMGRRSAKLRRVIMVVRDVPFCAALHHYRTIPKPVPRNSCAGLDSMLMLGPLHWLVASLPAPRAPRRSEQHPTALTCTNASAIPSFSVRALRCLDMGITVVPRHGRDRETGRACDLRKR